MVAVRRRKPSLPWSAAFLAALPRKLSPQLATPAAHQPANHDDWLYEAKLEGYRLLTRVQGPDVKLITAKGEDWTARLPVLAADLRMADLPNGWYDGELVARNTEGLCDFGALQLVFDTRVHVPMELYLFDLPYFDGYDLRKVPLEGRRRLLREVLMARPQATSVKFSEEFQMSPDNVLAAASKMGLEGVIGKRRNGAYVSRRSSTWIKLRCARRPEFAIAGYTE